MHKWYDFSTMSFYHMWTNFNRFQVTRKLKHVLPTVARLCLISTFLEDGIRMWVQWSEQREYMNMSWGCGYFLATVFVLVNLIGQLGGCGMVVFQFKVTIACGVLFFIVVLQVSWIPGFLFTNCSLIYKSMFGCVYVKVLTKTRFIW